MMNHKYIQILLCTLIIITIQACAMETHSNIIDDELQIHFENFQKEANIRGLDLNMANENISGYIDYIQEEGVIGNCTRYSTGRKELTISVDHWKSSSHLDKELVVFHELGHCILGREHTESRNKKGLCTSIMTAGNGKCKLEYNSKTRAALLNELFK